MCMGAFETTVTIRFGDADPAGIVFYPRAIELAHGVVEDLLRRTESGWDGWFANADFAMPVRRMESDFLAPMRAGETLTAKAHVEKCGTTSVTFVVELSGPKGDVRARFRMVHVLVDCASGRPAALTEGMRRELGEVSAAPRAQCASNPDNAPN